LKTLKKFLVFAAVQIVFIPLFCFLLVYYGPFHDIRGTIVYTAMHTSRHKYIATWFLSDKKIEEILIEYAPALIDAEQAPGEITAEHSGSRKTEVFDVYAGLSKGKLMVIGDPARIALAVSDGLGAHGSTLSQLLALNRASSGINAGAYIDDGASSRGGTPGGVIIKDGKLIYFEDTKESHCVIGFKNNILTVKTVHTKDEADALGLDFAVSFGPALIINGQPLVKKDSVAIHPRTAIAQRKDGTVLLLVLDGRQSGSAGATLKDMEQILLKHGAHNAANLDGGSSTTMVYQGNIINTPSENGREMYLPSAFIVRDTP